MISKLEDLQPGDIMFGPIEGVVLSDLRPTHDGYAGDGAPTGNGARYSLRAYFALVVRGLLK